jgi:hypothetical protein
MESILKKKQSKVFRSQVQQLIIYWILSDVAISRIHSPWLGGIKLTTASGCRTGLQATKAGRTILCRSQLYPPYRDYEYGYSSVEHLQYSTIATNT